MLNSSTDVFVKSFTHLKSKPNAARALDILKRIASLVKPIMRKHNWVLPVLCEFFPAQSNLLGMNVNAGQKILLRLRPAHAEDTFLDEEDILGTMLHELTHNVHGPHDEKFYKFLAELNDEYDALQRSGYAGEGFFSKGQRLGTNVSHDLPPHLSKSKAIEAAEKRKRAEQVLGGGAGRRLGGSTANLSPRELAARAAERRARDDKECQCGDVAQREAEKAAKDSVKTDVIDLTLDDSDDDEVEIVPLQTTSKVNRPKRRAVSPAKSAPPLKVARVQPKLKPDEWTCDACTLINPPLVLQCEACWTARPQDGWGCLACGETGMPHEFWTCRSCGTIKSSSAR